MPCRATVAALEDPRSVSCKCNTGLSGMKNETERIELRPCGTCIKPGKAAGIRPGQSTIQTLRDTVAGSGKESSSRQLDRESQNGLKWNGLAKHAPGSPFVGALKDSPVYAADINI